MFVDCSKDSTNPTPTETGKLSGHWIGSTSHNSLNMKITQIGGKLIGEVECIKILGGTEFDYTVDVNGNFSDPKVEMFLTGTNLSMLYEGTLSSDGNAIDGIFVDEFTIPDSITLVKQ
jgi:hypothetical protein